MSGDLSIPKLQLTSALRAVADVMAAVAAFLACFVVGRISEAQERKRELQLQLLNRDVSVSAPPEAGEVALA